MNRKQATFYVAVAGSIAIIMILAAAEYVVSDGKLSSTPSSQTVISEGGGQIVMDPHDLVVRMKKLESLEDRIEMPTNDANEVRHILKEAYVAWRECQDIVNSDRLEIQNVNGVRMAHLVAEKDTVAFHFVFQSRGRLLSQGRKLLVSDRKDPNSGTELKYKLDFYENGYIKRYEDQEEHIVRFYPSGSVETAYFLLQAESARAITWTEDGTIVTQRTGDRIDESRFLSEGRSDGTMP